MENPIQTDLASNRSIWAAHQAGSSRLRSHNRPWMSSSMRQTGIHETVSWEVGSESRKRERSRIIDLKPEVCLVLLLRHRQVRKGKRALLLLWDLAMALCCWDGCSWVLPRRTWKRELSLEAPPPSLPCPRLSRSLSLSRSLFPRAFLFLLWMWNGESTVR